MGGGRRLLFVGRLSEDDADGGKLLLGDDGDDGADVDVVFAQQHVVLRLAGSETSVVRLVLGSQDLDEPSEPGDAARRQVRKVELLDPGQGQELDELVEGQSVGRVVKPVPEMVAAAVAGRAAEGGSQDRFRGGGLKLQNQGSSMKNIRSNSSKDRMTPVEWGC